MIYTGLDSIVTKATQIIDDSQDRSFIPRVYTDQQVKGWQLSTSARHRQGTVIFCELWHVGGCSHSEFQQGEQPTISSNSMLSQKTNSKIIDRITPREMTQSDIDDVIKDFASSAKRAIEAGFDSIWIHASNGYLIDQFLRTSSNNRTDSYGGSRENRIRFLIEVINAVIEAIGADKVGVRLAPFISHQDINSPELNETMIDVAKALQARNVAYLHLSEANWDGAPVIPESFRISLRAFFTNTIIVAGDYTQQRSDEMLDKGYADLIDFDRPFIVNPNLV